jgi:cytochrome P450
MSSAKSEMIRRGTSSPSPWLDYLLRRNPLSLRLSGTSPFVRRAISKLSERRSNPHLASDRTDLLSQFLAVQKSDPDKVPEEFITLYVMTMLLAGADTTTITLRAIVWFLFCHSRVVDRLRVEIKEARLGSFPGSWRELQTLPYLDAVVREGMRLHPLTLGQLQRVVGPDGNGMGLSISVRGREVVLPVGTKLGVSLARIHRDKTIFGEDADNYRPERWMKGRNEEEVAYRARLQAMNKVDLSFGQASRGCIGKNIARMEMYKLLPALVERFEMRFLDVENGFRLDEGLFAYRVGMDMEIKLREKEEE